MGVLVRREARPELPCAANQRPGDGSAFAGFGFRVDLLDGAHDQGTDGRTGPLGALFEAFVEGFGKLDGGCSQHVVIMLRSEAGSKIFKKQNGPAWRQVHIYQQLHAVASTISRSSASQAA